MLAMSQESMGSPIYYTTDDNRWIMARRFDPTPGTVAFVTDNSWIMDFYLCFGE